MKKEFCKSDFNYELPEELIAAFPLPERSASRMLVCNLSEDNKLEIFDQKFKNFPNFLNKHDLLIFNNTKVIPARLYAQKISGGKVEMLIEKIVENHHFRAYLKASKTPKIGDKIYIAEHELIVEKREEALFYLHSQIPIAELLKKYGEMPIPPYFARRSDENDKERYQTVFAKNEGAVAAPTAGLHFDESLLKEIKNQGINSAEVTLHVGAGTFQPVRHEDLQNHVMHQENFFIPAATIKAIQNCRKNNGRVIAVGTTSLRALETWFSAENYEKLEEFSGESRLFIYPPYEFKVVDALLTNFHLPESTLIMLVSAFLGYENVKEAYQFAINNKYRFFSYGDCMFIPKRFKN